MTLAWRVLKEKHQGEAFSGEGAKLFGGRWNRKGQAVVYLADSMALAALEQFVHLTPLARGMVCGSFQVTVPKQIYIEFLANNDLPGGWRGQPPISATMDLGSSWFQGGQSALLSVPTALLPAGRNLLLNCGHHDFAKLKIQAPVCFSFDSRMWQ